MVTTYPCKGCIGIRKYLLEPFAGVSVQSRVMTGRLP